MAAGELIPRGQLGCFFRLPAGGATGVDRHLSSRNGLGEHYASVHARVGGHDPDVGAGSGGGGNDPSGFRNDGKIAVRRRFLRWHDGLYQGDVSGQASRGGGQRECEQANGE